MTLPAESAVLLQRGWFSRLPADVQRALLDAAVWREIAEGQTFNRGGDEEGGIWGVARGQIDAVSAVSAPDTPIADTCPAGAVGRLWAGVRVPARGAWHRAHRDAGGAGPAGARHGAAH